MSVGSTADPSFTPGLPPSGSYTSAGIQVLGNKGYCEALVSRSGDQVTVTINLNINSNSGTDWSALPSDESFCLGGLPTGSVFLQDTTTLQFPLVYRRFEYVYASMGSNLTGKFQGSGSDPFLRYQVYPGTSGENNTAYICFFNYDDAISTNTMKSISTGNIKAQLIFSYYADPVV